MFCKREYFQKEDVPALIEGQFYILKKYHKKIELVKVKCKDEKRIQKCIDNYLRKVDDVSLYLIEIVETNPSIENDVINELKKKIKTTDCSLEEKRASKILDVIIYNIKSNRIFE